MVHVPSEVFGWFFTAILVAGGLFLAFKAIEFVVFAVYETIVWF